MSAFPWIGDDLDNGGLDGDNDGDLDGLDQGANDDNGDDLEHGGHHDDYDGHEDESDNKGDGHDLEFHRLCDSERALVKLNAFFQGGHRITKAHGTP